MNEDALSIINQAEDMEVIDVSRMRISQEVPYMVEFEMEIEAKYFEDFMSALNNETLAFELVRD